MKLKNSNCDKTQIETILNNLKKTQIVILKKKIKNSNCDKTQIQIVAKLEL